MLYQLCIFLGFCAFMYFARVKDLPLYEIFTPGLHITTVTMSLLFVINHNISPSVFLLFNMCLLTLRLFVYNGWFVFSPIATMSRPSRTLLDTMPKDYTTHKYNFDQCSGLLIKRSFKADSHNRPIILFCPGNGLDVHARTKYHYPTLTQEEKKGCKDCVDSLNFYNQSAFFPPNADVFGVDYPGYGLNHGFPSCSGAYLSVEKAWNYVIQQLNYSPDNIIIYGEIFGAGPAVELVDNLKRKGAPLPRALILRSPFTSLKRLVREFIPFEFSMRLQTDINEPMTKQASANMNGFLDILSQYIGNFFVSIITVILNIMTIFFPDYFETLRHLPYLTTDVNILLLQNEGTIDVVPSNHGAQLNQLMTVSKSIKKYQYIELKGKNPEFSNDELAKQIRDFIGFENSVFAEPCDLKSQSEVKSSTSGEVRSSVPSAPSVSFFN